jgi:hypothetical protein
LGHFKPVEGEANKDAGFLPLEAEGLSMGKSVSNEYLDDERKKLWASLIALDDKLEKRTPEHVSEAKQASKMATEYKNKSALSKNTILEYEEASKAALDRINDLVDAVIVKRNETIANSEFIESNAEVASKLLDDLKNRIDEVNGDITELETLFNEHGTYAERINALEDISQKATETFSKIDLNHKFILTKRKEIDEAHREIFGYKDTDASGEEHEVAGLKDELEESFSDISEKVDAYRAEFNSLVTSTQKGLHDLKSEQHKAYEEAVSSWKAEHSAIMDKIKSLLPHAMTAGLSHAYAKKREAEEVEIRAHTVKFERSITYMALCALIPFAVSITFLIQGKGLDEVILELPRIVLAILPLYIPIMWIAYSTSKRINLSKRLVEEYTHKEVLSKTFEGLVTQINDIPANDISNELRIKLLYNILEVSSENPGKLITDYNKSDHPLMDALDKSVQLTNAVEKLTKIPGFTKLATVLEQKSKDILEDKASKANAGLATLKQDDEETEDKEAAK